MRKHASWHLRLFREHAHGGWRPVGGLCVVTALALAGASQACGSSDNSSSGTGGSSASGTASGSGTGTHSGSSATGTNSGAGTGSGTGAGTGSGAGSTGTSGTGSTGSGTGTGGTGSASGAGGTGSGTGTTGNAGTTGAATGTTGGTGTGGTTGGAGTAGTTSGTGPNDSGAPKPDATVPGSGCTGATKSTSTAATTTPKAPAVTLPTGFEITGVASISAARQLVALPNGDLLVATNALSVYIVPSVEDTPGAAALFATLPSGESAAQGITFDASSCTIYVATTSHIYAMAYTDGQMKATPGTAIASVRTGMISPYRPSGDTDNHTTTSLGFAGGKLYAGVGSSCNACVEVDPTRASVQVMDPTGANMAVRATRFRNAIALATNPATGTIWAGGAGQDDLAEGHPYEFFDAVGLHSGVADYGWPDCEENHTEYQDAGAAGCTNTVAPLVEMPAYSTIIGAAFYPASPSGTFAFPQSYRGGLFLTAHGSWHMNGDTYYSPPRIAFVAMNGDAPTTAVDWSDPTKQWTEFVGGYQSTNSTMRIGRPTGIAVGSEGSLFVSDDQNNAVYRIRPM
jgi:glucose/arabinose dehydrogenase